MAFSTTVNDNGSPIKKGVRSIIVTLAGGVGVSTPFQSPDAYALTIQLSGEFGGGTVTLEASNDGVSWFPAQWLTIASATPFTATAAGMAIVHPSLLGVRHYRLVLTGASAAADIIAYCVAVMQGGRN